MHLEKLATVKKNSDFFSNRKTSVKVNFIPVTTEHRKLNISLRIKGDETTNFPLIYYSPLYYFKIAKMTSVLK